MNFLLRLEQGGKGGTPVLHRTSRTPLVLHCTPLYSTVLRLYSACTPLVLHLYSTRTPLYSVVLCCTLLYSAVLRCTPLYSTRTPLYSACTPLVLRSTGVSPFPPCSDSDSDKFFFLDSDSVGVGVGFRNDSAVH